MATRGLTIRTESFEGPLDLLLHLIHERELDISKVSIERVTDQYLAHISLMQEIDFDLASEFLVMAATLLLWKSRSLLPQEKQDEIAVDEGPLSQDDLVRQLLRLQQFRAAGADLAQQNLLGKDVFARANAKPPVERVWREMSITSLALCMQDVIVRARKRKQVLRKETVSLSDKILEFRDKLELGVITELRRLLSTAPSRAETVVTFLASLELARLKKLRVYQEEVYRPIYVELIDALLDLNMSLVQTFGSATETKPESPAPEVNP